MTNDANRQTKKYLILTISEVFLSENLLMSINLICELSSAAVSSLNYHIELIYDQQTDFWVTPGE